MIFHSACQAPKKAFMIIFDGQTCFCKGKKSPFVFHWKHNVCEVSFLGELCLLAFLWFTAGSNWGWSLWFNSMNYGNKAKALRRIVCLEIICHSDSFSHSTERRDSCGWSSRSTSNDIISSSTNICTQEELMNTMLCMTDSCHSLRCLKSALLWLKMFLIPIAVRGASKSTSSSAVNLLEEEETRMSDSLQVIPVLLVLTKLKLVFVIEIKYKY